MVEAYKWPWAYWWDIWPTRGVEGGVGALSRGFTGRRGYWVLGSFW